MKENRTTHNVEQTVRKVARRVLRKAPFVAGVLFAAGTTAACYPDNVIIHDATPTPRAAAGTPTPPVKSGECTTVLCYPPTPTPIVITGPEGKPGKDGKDGKQGEPGKDGAQGPRGPEGARGPQGDRGPIGPAGRDGVQVPAIPTATRAPSAATTECDVMAITSLPPRPSAHVNGIGVRLEVRDKNECVRDLFYNETGVGKTQEYKVDITEGWTLITASISAVVNSDSAPRKTYTGGPEIMIKNFKGVVTVEEGAVYVVPNEWAQKRSEEILAIQRKQTRNPNLQITYHTDGPQVAPTLPTPLPTTPTREQPTLSQEGLEPVHLPGFADIWVKKNFDQYGFKIMVVKDEVMINGNAKAPSGIGKITIYDGSRWEMGVGESFMSLSENGVDTTFVRDPKKLQQAIDQAVLEAHRKGFKTIEVTTIDFPWIESQGQYTRSQKSYFYNFNF